MSYGARTFLPGVSPKAITCLAPAFLFKAVGEESVRGVGPILFFDGVGDFPASNVPCFGRPLIEIFSNSKF